METNLLSVYNFKLQESYPAVVEKITQSGVLFKVKLSHNSREFYYANYHVTGGNLNLFKIFKKQEETAVKIIKVFRNETLVVIPQILPVDQFLEINPVNSVVEGTVYKISGATMIIKLAPNVFCTTKRCNHAKLKMVVLCKIKNYNVNKKTLSILIIA